MVYSAGYRHCTRVQWVRVYTAHVHVGCIHPSGNTGLWLYWALQGPYRGLWLYWLYWALQGPTGALLALLGLLALQGPYRARTLSPAGI